MFNIEEELKKLPPKAGVYIMYDKADAIIYVGKAISLRSRVRSYFRDSTVKSLKITRMVEQIIRFEYIVTDSELEALVLENNFIKEHRPKYNTMLKDDKTYPYIKVTIGEKFPRVLFVRQVKKDKAKYFGPYTSAGAVKDTIELLNKLYQIRTCNRNLPKDTGKDRPCLNYHIKQCRGPCQGYITEETYHENVEQALEFLNGNYDQILKVLEKKMEDASERLAFEDAITYRDLYHSVKQVSQKQKITDSHLEDKDIIGLAQNENSAVVQIFFIRNGKLIGREHFYMTNVEGNQDIHILQEFIKQFYGGTPFIPKELLLAKEVEEVELLEQWLSNRRGSKVKINAPQKGKKEKLVELASKNASMILTKDSEKLKREEVKTIGAVREIAQWIELPHIYRLEAFDISNINGYQNVGSMVVYENGKPKRSDYRKFKIKSVTGPDDYACMKEVITRRFQHGLEERKEYKEKEIENTFGKFTKFPDVLLMDGGKGQVNIAIEVLKELKLDIPVVGMVKDNHHRTRGLYYHGKEVFIDSHSEGFHLITRIQDEAHRFAIEYHRSLRGKTQVKSVLDDIPGIGPNRRKALMKYFASLDEIKNADKDTLLQVPELNKKVVEDIYSFFHSE